MPCTLDVEIVVIGAESTEIAITTESCGTETHVQTVTENITLEVTDNPCSSGSGDAGFSRVVGEPMSALRVVWEDTNGVVWPLDALDETHIDLICGLTITAAATGNRSLIQRDGVVNSDGLGLSAGRVWLGANGSLTQVAPVGGFDILIGNATDDNRLYLNLNDNIQLFED